MRGRTSAAPPISTSALGVGLKSTSVLQPTSAWARVPSPAPGVGTTGQRGGRIRGEFFGCIYGSFYRVTAYQSSSLLLFGCPCLVFSKFARPSQGESSARPHPVPVQARVARARELAAGLQGDRRALVCSVACRAPRGKLWWGCKGLSLPATMWAVHCATLARRGVGRRRPAPSALLR